MVANGSHMSAWPWVRVCMAKSNREHPRECVAMSNLEHLRIRLGRNAIDFYFVDMCTCWLYVEMTGYVNLPFRVVVKVYWCSSLLIFWVTTSNLWSSFRYISTKVWCTCRVVVFLLTFQLWPPSWLPELRITFATLIRWKLERVNVRKDLWLFC